ncbi:MAG TPA: holo-ACP synthase [Ktedonobacterales bacterium]|nr:holo-ACP synthase [Ktedonobacterales bacterium]
MTDSQAGEPQQSPPPSEGDRLQGQGHARMALPPNAFTRLAGVAVGADLVEVERITQTVQRFGPRFLQRIFTPEELQESRSRMTWLAGRFAAKEACAKALGTGIGAQAAWRDMRVLRQPNGKPELRLSGDAAARAAMLGLTAFDLSIAHTHQFAMAVVVGLTAVPGTMAGDGVSLSPPPNSSL